MCWSLNANDGSAARAVRKAATAILREHSSSEETLGAAELVIGELLSNAARHADGQVCLELGLAEGHAQVSVHDTSSKFALDFKRPPDDYSESGRGLFIVSEIARKISVIPLTGIGKRVTVLLDFPVASSTAFVPTCLRQWLRHESDVCMHPRVTMYHRSETKR